MRKPNIVFILADDMGYGDIRAYGNEAVHTPTLDRLSEESISLMQHYSAAPVCTPARAGLLTGRYPHRTGAIDMRELRGLSRLKPSELTIADLLKAQGYATGLVGKWHLGTVGKEYHPNRRGFDEFVGFRGGLTDYYDYRLYENETLRPGDGTYLTDVFAREAVNFIRRHRSEPFFLHLAFNAPHMPLQAPEEDIRPFLEQNKWSKGVCLIYGMIRRMDRGIAQVLEELDKQGLREDTIVVFASDNGPQFGGRGDMSTHRYNGELAGAKGQVYEGGIKVPGIVRWPARWKGGMKSDLFMHFTDWLPTLLAMAGVPVPPGLQLDGCNVLPWLEGSASRQDDAPRFWQWNRYTPLITCNAAMRDGDWKLVRPSLAEAMQVDPADYQTDREVELNPELYADIDNTPLPFRHVPDPPPPQLYHLGEDPGERRDIAAQHPQRVAGMIGKLEAWFADVEADRRRD